MASASPDDSANRPSTHSTGLGAHAAMLAMASQVAARARTTRREENVNRILHNNAARTDGEARCDRLATISWAG